MKIFKSYSFWTTLAGAVVLFVNLLSKLCGFAVESELISDVIMAFAGILVALGIVTMPKNNGNNEENAEQEDVEKESEEDAGNNSNTDNNSQEDSEEKKD